jgi:hypothetical protein
LNVPPAKGPLRNEIKCQSDFVASNVPCVVLSLQVAYPQPRMKYTYLNFLSFIVLTITLQLPTNGGEQQKSSQGKQKTANAHAGVTTEPSSISITNNEVCPCKRDNKVENKTEPTPEKSFWGDAPTWALVIVGLVAAIIALSTLHDIKKQTGHLARFAEATTIIANATLNADRAWIDVVLGKPATTIDEFGYKIGYNPNAGEYGRYGIYITNYGRTVARITDFKVWSATFANIKDIDLSKFAPRIDSNIQILFAANHPAFVIEDFDFVALFEDWKSIQDRKMIALIRIDVRYEDVVRGEIVGRPHEPHKTTAIFGWDVESEGPWRLPKYNDYT